jgi:predicted dehydrogenase
MNINNNKKIFFGILGLGRVFSNRLLDVFTKEVTGTKIKGVFDKDSIKNIKFSKILNLSLIKNIKDFFKLKLDFIYIATESGNHAKHIKYCFDANKNVVVEKPPTLKVDQLLELQKIASKKKLFFFVIFQNRFNKSVLFVKKYLTRKILKKIIFVNLKLIWSRDQSYYNDWHGNWLMDGGVLSQQGIHYIDLLCYFFGQPIKCISVIEKKSNKLEAEDTHVGIICFNNDINCQISLTTAIRPQDLEASIEIITKDQKILLNGLCCNKLKILNHDLSNKKNNAKISKKFSSEVPTGYGLSHASALQGIVDYSLKIKNSIKPLKAIDTLNTIKLLNMLYRSSEKKTWAYFKENNFQSKLGN